jgi:hypothetical protein
MNPQLPRQLEILFPTAKPGVDYIVVDRVDGNGPVIAQWNLSAAQPSAGQLGTAAAQVTANDSLRASLLAAFDALPSGVQAAFHDCLKAVDALLISGQVTAAQTLISTTPVPSTLTATQTSLLSLFPAPPAS